LISQSMVFALISLLFAGLNDFVFKKQTIKSSGCGRYMAVAGAVWLLVFAALALVSGATRLSAEALKWGVAVGAFSAAANYLLIRSLRHLDASVGATIYRLNLLSAAIIAVVFLHEKLTVLNTSGIILASMAVLLFCEQSRSGRTPGWRLAFFVVFVASLLRAIMGIGYKLASYDLVRLRSEGYQAQDHWFLALQGFMWLVTGLTAARFEGGCESVRRDLRYGLVSGILICGIVLFFNLAMASGKAVAVIPVSQMSFLVTTALSVAALKEHVSRRKSVALATSVVAILLLSLSG